VFQELQHAQIVRIKIEAVGPDSTIVKLHPAGSGALEKTGPQSIGKSRGGWSTKIHMVAGCSNGHYLRLVPGRGARRPAGPRWRWI
jgi:hypothetical protein